MRDLRNKHDFRRSHEEGELTENEKVSKLPNLRFCRHCGSYNKESGQCVMCYKSLGSLKVAIIAGLVSTLVYGSFWLLLNALTKMQLPLLAIIYGAMVSLGVDYYSRGRGVVFQLIATVFTIAGIVFFDVLEMELTYHLAGLNDMTDHSLVLWLEKLKYGLFYDDFTILYAILGVAGGRWIWRSNGSYSD